MYPHAPRSACNHDVFLLVATLATFARSSVLFAPYVDTTVDNFNLAACHAETGTNAFALAFVTADKNNQPQFNGNLVSDGWYQSQVKAIRGLGGDVVVSFGGEMGNELGIVSTSATALANKYIAVIQAYSANTWTLTLSNRAIKIVQTQYPNVEVAYTLPSAIFGLVDTGLNIINSATAHEAGWLPDINQVGAFADSTPYVSRISLWNANIDTDLGAYAVAFLTHLTHSQPPRPWPPFSVAFKILLIQ
ncbi:hypothetical protein BC830DRAFT_1221137 [Chytriomyces sp. MP71]|nr:hypothetical protein BC830DRAFT_1221137 [Chytriomyces sp. MP71]